MIRRVVTVLAALFGLAILAMAIAPWTTSSSALKAAIAGQLREAYGLELTVAGRSTIAFLPVPRLKFEDIALEAPDGTPLVRGGQLRGEFQILPLLLGRLELSEVALNGSRIDVDIDSSGQTAWATSFEKIRASLEDDAPSSTHVRRMALTGSYLVFRGRTGAEAVIRDISVTVKWPARDRAADVAGRFIWLGEAVEVAVTGIRPAALATGRASPFALQVSAAPSSLRLSGDVNFGDDPRMVGRAAFETRSFRDFIKWTGFPVPLSGLLGTLALEGDFTLDRRTVSYPAIRLTVGGDRLDGALSIRFDGVRPLVASTLAADRLDLSSIFAPIAQARGAGDQWSPEPLDIGPLTTGSDLDLRLSALDARLGSVRFGDLAANIMVKPGRIETTLGRATLNGGLVKGRLGLFAAEQGVDLRVQGSFEHLDAGAFLSGLGQPRWLSGQAQGQFTIEGSATPTADIVRQSHGRAVVTVRTGELIGIDLIEAVRRADRGPSANPAEVPGGRTLFDQAQVSLHISNGVAEIVDGLLSAQDLRAVLQGRASLAERTFAVKANLGGAGRLNDRKQPSATIDINGSWDGATVALADARPEPVSRAQPQVRSKFMREPAPAQ